MNRAEREDAIAVMIVHRAWEAQHGPGEVCDRCPQPITDELLREAVWYSNRLLSWERSGSWLW